MPYAGHALLLNLSIARGGLLVLVHQFLEPRLSADLLPAWLLGVTVDVLGLLLSAIYLIVGVVLGRAQYDAVLLTFIVASTVSLLPPYLWFIVFYMLEPRPSV